MIWPRQPRQRTASGHEPISIVESSHDAIVGITPEGAVTTWHPAATRLYGYSPGEIVGRAVRVLCPPERQAEAAETLARILRGEEIGPYLTDGVRGSQ
jgi:PAS domain S-box-containing protein